MKQLPREVVLQRYAILSELVVISFISCCVLVHMQAVVLC